MRRIILALTVLLMASPAFASVHHITINNNTTVVNEQDHQAFDWGSYLNVVAFETKNTEWGFLGTYLQESSETRVMAGGKIYLNRMTYQK